MSRLIRNTAILAKMETVYGVDAVPTGAANAMLVSTLSINPLNAQNVDRNNIRPFLGGDEQLVGSRYVEMGFDVELVGAGTLGTAPAWGPLLRACGFAEVITAGVRVDYVPISTGFESLTIDWYDDGVLHKGMGARGTASLKLSVGEKPVISCKFVCLYGGIGVAAAPTADLEEWQVPEIVLDANSGKLMWGATHATTTPPALIGGDSYPSKGLTIDLGVTSPFQALLGGESVPITERKVTGAVQLELTAAQEVAAMAAVLATAKTSLGMVHGTVAGSRVAVFMPGVQRIEPSKEDLNGARMIGYKLLVNPIAGNDEIRIATSF
ncbi:phage tail tube protein [Janthinobacterium sp. LS2A]|uniref:phage tail tube protein n=1 Tax=Janthinobacterium sp. LS2A TaxID=3118590 RepID=UPI002F93C92C